MPEGSPALALVNVTLRFRYDIRVCVAKTDNILGLNMIKLSVEFALIILKILIEGNEV